MSNVAQKRPFASLIDDETNESTPPPSPPQQDLQPVLMTPAEKKWCNQTIKALKKHKRAIAFLVPVDPVQFNIPDYFDIIKHPMDLGTVEKKLQNDEYPTVNDFKADIQLIFYNCHLYNHKGDPVCLDAKKLEEHFHKLCKKEPSKLAAAKADIQAHPPQYESEPLSSATDITNGTNSNHLLNSQTPTSLKLTTTPTTITIPSQPKQNLSNIKVKLPTSAHTTSSTSFDEIKLSPKRSSSTSLPPTNITPQNSTGIMPEEQYKRCVAIVKELKKPKYQHLNWPFLQPVDAAACSANDYFDVIKHPMDMSTYEKKLYNSEYSSEDELVNDIHLMFRNCYTYNPPAHLVHQLGKQLEQVFEKQWAKLQSRSQGKKHSATSAAPGKQTVKKRRTSATDTNYAVPTAYSDHNESTDDMDTANNKVVINDVVMHEASDDVNNNVGTPVSATSSNNTPNSGRSTILRLKLSVKPKEEDQPKPKPVTKIPGLALSKEPPPTTSNGIKLGIGSKVTSPVKEKKSDKLTPTVLHNHDKWLALANKKSPTESSSQSRTQVHHAPLARQGPPPHSSHGSTVKRKEIVSPTTATKPNVPVTPQVPAFDINDIYNKIHNEKKLKEQKKREEQEKWERNERLRLEKEKLLSEERMRQIREFNQHLQAQRKKDNQERLRDLNSHRIDISKQKMAFARFESQCMARDQDWREIYTWQRETIDYRHIPVPGFVKRAPAKLEQIRKQLLSKCVRLENSKTSNQAQTPLNDGESDMDVE